jgi:hypothetical protein
MNLLAATLFAMLMAVPPAFAGGKKGGKKDNPKPPVVCEKPTGKCYEYCYFQNGKWIVYKTAKPLSNVCTRDGKTPTETTLLTFEECAQLPNSKCWKGGNSVTPIDSNMPRRLQDFEIPDTPGLQQCSVHCEGKHRPVTLLHFAKTHQTQITPLFTSPKVILT